jgi:hypothetical protein
MRPGVAKGSGPLPRTVEIPTPALHRQPCARSDPTFDRHLDLWRHVPDGPPIAARNSLLPVRKTGRPAMLKFAEAEERRGGIAMQRDSIARDAALGVGLSRSLSGLGDRGVWRCEACLDRRRDLGSGDREILRVRPTANVISTTAARSLRDRPGYAYPGRISITHADRCEATSKPPGAATSPACPTPSGSRRPCAWWKPGWRRGP